MAAVAPIDTAERESEKPINTEAASPQRANQWRNPSRESNQSIRVFHHGKIEATTGTARQRSIEGTSSTTLLRGTMLVCMRMACAPFPGHSIIGVLFCHVFYLLAALSRCIIGTPEPGASVDLEIPSLSHMTSGHYVGLLLACVQALVIGAVCSDEAFESNQWGGLGVFAAFIGLVWIVLRNVPSITTDVAELGASTAASTATFTLILEILACIGPDLLLFTADAKNVLGSASDSTLAVCLLLVVGAHILIGLFIIYANQSGSSFSVDVSNEEEDWVLKRVLRNMSGLLFIAVLLLLGVVGLVAPFVSAKASHSDIQISVQNPTETPAKLGGMLLIFLSDVGLAVLQTCLLPRCQCSTCGESAGVLVAVETGSP